ncbi:aminodeoxychorismate synthase component I [Maricurvus nonylphenolicus]|uniref:aminodeoxychorismate synthase component I n=1 Tax=Maricurvus nonylphenolicus TaxID=1008307 RepID=UPI0036F1BDEC
MATPHLVEIPYQSSLGYFLAIRHMSWPVWLDSGPEASNRGRYDILAAAPETQLISSGNNVSITTKEQSLTRTGNPLDILAEHLPDYTCCGKADIPFCGGAIGYLAYDLGRQLETLPEQAENDIQLPDMQIGIYSWAVVQDHMLKRSHLVALPSVERCELEQLAEQLKRPKDINTPFKIKGLESNFDVESYSKAFTKIQEYIHAGDCYQVNLAQRFSGDYSGDPLTAYIELRKKLPSPFSGYFEPDQGAILSLSPERFVEVKQRRVKTQPIKGTISRGSTPEQDQSNAYALKNSVKDRAENLMIVDLLRNDLSKVCSEGSVSTTRLFDLESYANVHHLVSTIEAELEEQETPTSLLKSSFPGGSITGAPKIRAMEIIEELEPCRRSAYCGSLGYISANQNMDTNIAIRTLVCDQSNRIHCWGGGGIVADSDMETEYQESLTKIGVILDTLQSL